MGGSYSILAVKWRMEHGAEEEEARAVEEVTI